MAGERIRTLNIYGKLFSIDSFQRIKYLEGDKDFPFTVTLTQLEILSQIAKGRSYKEIAGSRGTTAQCVSNLMEKLRLNNGEVSTISLVNYAVRIGILHPHKMDDDLKR